MISTLLLLLMPVTGAVTDIERSLHETLNGRDTSVAAVQAAWAETMGLRVTTASGVVATGDRATLVDLDTEALDEEIPDGARVRNYVEIDGHGPEPLYLYLPKSPDDAPNTIYRRVEPGLFVEPAKKPVAVGGYWKVEVDWPGRFVVHEPQHPGEGKVLFPEYPPTSTDPARKSRWRFFRAAPRDVVGPVPLILIHGANTDRWQSFIAWASDSPQAAAFRQNFQIWNFSHDMTGVNASIGFDPNCPGFGESIVAYLYDFLEEATEFGFPTGEDFYKFPAEGPITIMTNSHGALKARAFMVNFPEYGNRVAGALSLGGPHMGTPLATAEWLRLTASRVGLLKPTLAERVVADALATNYVTLDDQSDLDMGWLNADGGAGYGGIPYEAFDSFIAGSGVERRVLSPRDSSITDARELPGFNDNTFDPQEPLSTYCGGLDLITPAFRGDKYADRFFVYGAYLYRGRGWLEFLLNAGDGVMAANQVRVENTALRLINLMMGLVPAEDASWPSGAYRVADGFVPLQSALMLDGRETTPVFKTQEVFGWRVPVLPYTPDMDVIREHTLANPDRVRIWPGWSHLDMTTGRYNKATGDSELYVQVAADLLSVISGG